MDNKNKIIEYINRSVKLTNEEAEQFSACFREVQVKRRQFLVQPNYTAKHRNYVVKGAFRVYVVNKNGVENTIQFAIEDWWTSDISSYLNQLPATMFVVALEDSIVLQIDFENEQILKKSNHKFETFFRILAERGLSFMYKRIIANLTQTAEERYDDFMNQYPLIAQRVPQHALASYLGFRTEFLSRLRRKKTNDKLT